MALSAEKYGHQDDKTLVFIENHIVHLMRQRRYLEVEMLAKQCLVHEPERAQGLSMNLWTRIIFYLVLSLLMQGDFAQSERHIRGILRRLHSLQAHSSWHDDIIDPVYDLLGKLTTHRKYDDAMGTRQKYPGSVEREEEWRGAIASRLEKIAAQDRPTQDTSAPKASKGKTPLRT
ncbi:MAG: hypothetical protein M1835_001994 [Candelina submexicana]|nr:MAG: hypothetical protein M1835_001994 [Candelina submexicana]